MEQTKVESLIESVVNQFIGVVIAYGVWRLIIIPVFNIPNPGFVNNMAITLTFTGISIIRGYLLRRFFNKGLHRTVHKFVAGMIKH
jgi:hypothetical protein